MQVTFEEVSRFCFVVFSPAISVCVAVSLFSSVSTRQRWKPFIYFILCLFEHFLKWVFLSGVFRTEGGGGGGFLSLLGRGGRGGESDLLFQLPAHVSIYVVHLLHRPRFSKERCSLRWHRKGMERIWKTSPPLQWVEKWPSDSKKRVLGSITLPAWCHLIICNSSSGTSEL